MSRFADPSATRTVPLGACECPGAPHDSDWAKVRAELSTTEIGKFAGAETPEDIAEAVGGFVTEWNLLGPNGEPWPPSAASIIALKPPTLTLIVESVGETVQASSSVPNAPGAPSRSSSRGSASRTRTTPAKH